MKIQNSKKTKTTTIMASLAIGLLMIFPTIGSPINAQTTSQSSDHTAPGFSAPRSTQTVAELLKAGYESTPIGYLPHGCVLHVGNNATVQRDESVIMANGTHLRAPHCEGKAVKGPVPTTNNWVEYGSAEPRTSLPAISYFSAQWTIPPDPKNVSDLQTIFLFNGLQPLGTSGTPLIQPVLQWGKPAISNFWQIASWYCTSSTSCFEGNSYPVISGNTVTGKMIGTSCVSGACNWEIDTTSISHGILRTSTMNYNSGTALYWLDGGVLEVYGVNNCGDYPPRGATPTTFNSFTIKDTSGTTITPTFGHTVIQNDGCNESVTASSTSVSLYYGNTS